jgi:hypothetical protein
MLDTYLVTIQGQNIKHDRLAQLRMFVKSRVPAAPVSILKPGIQKPLTAPPSLF